MIVELLGLKLTYLAKNLVNMNKCIPIYNKYLNSTNTTYILTQSILGRVMSDTIQLKRLIHGEKVTFKNLFTSY